ncbi:uncharacterized protein B0J16DRAFT_384253 [Fusarium flagelliforme]|uniref:uncharacterized protein n=1 Tax=Fusarium flagelliforme TaxID=2675880 RepID=UPI001E8E2516|nr:uncharacterized protein B0J16DRAFT_384253 [Fusarium flagelliforme]KAH7185194.1 hypothetical protein B0J16DRAFT_384253 [Fusarium flagelliforme]
MGAYVPYGGQAKSSARCFIKNITKAAHVAEPKMKVFLETALKNFEAIRVKMDGQLADELAYFVLLCSKEWGDKDLHLDDIRDNALYREAGSRLTQNIPYSLWFVLVSAFGPGHSALVEIRDALSKAWDSEIPTDTISYPACNSSSREFELFGIDPKLNAAASPAVKNSPIITSTARVDLTSPNAAKESGNQATTNLVADASRKASQVPPATTIPTAPASSAAATDNANQATTNPGAVASRKASQGSLASTPFTAPTSSAPAKDVATPEVTSNPLGSTFQKPRGTLKRPGSYNDTDQGYLSLEDSRFQMSNRKPKPNHSKPNSVARAASKELASRGKSSDGSANLRSSNSPSHGETNTLSSLFTAPSDQSKPGSLAIPTKPWSFDPTLPAELKGTQDRHWPDLMDMRPEDTTSTPARPTARQSTAETPPLVRSAPEKRRDMSRVYSQFDKDGKQKSPGWLHSGNLRLEAKIDDVRSRCRDGLEHLTSQTAYVRKSMNEKIERLETGHSSLESSHKEHKDLVAEEGLKFKETAKELQLSLDKWEDYVKAVEKQTDERTTELEAKHDEQKSTAERLIKELQSTNEKLADECEQRRLENVALRNTVNALQNQLNPFNKLLNQYNELVARQDAMEQFLERAFPPQPEGQSADNEEGQQETIDEMFSNNPNKRTLSPDGRSEGAAKRRRSD